MLDIERINDLTSYLTASGHLAPGEHVDCRVLTGGVSNRAILVRFADGRAWVIKQALAKLRVPVDWFSDPARIHREALGLRYLAQLAPPGAITPLVFEDQEHHLLAMQAVSEPHENWKSMLLAGRVDLDHVRQFASLLARTHTEAWRRRDELQPVFADAAFFESLRLEPYYAYTADQVPEASVFLHALAAETRSRRLTLVHGDFSPKNVLVRDGRLVLLDHEVIHWGDPAFDVGFALTHFLSKARHLSEHRATFLQAVSSFWVSYYQGIAAVPWAGELEPYAARHTLACLLARAAGRSQLEYLTPGEKAAQVAWAQCLVSASVTSITGLTDAARMSMSG